MEAIKSNEGVLAPNPFISIWTSPRDTIRRIVEHDPEHKVLLITCLAGIANLLGEYSSKSMGDRYEVTTLLILSVILGPIFGVIGLYVGAWLIRLTGKWVGGKASLEHLRTSIAWANVPMIMVLVLFIPEFLIYGPDLFTTEMYSVISSDAMYYSFMGFMLLEFTLAVWSLVILIKGVAQVQGFSSWVALGNLLLTLVVLIAIIVVFVLLLVFVLKV